MPYIEQIEEHEARGKLGEIYAAAKQRAGTVANIIKLMSLNPTLLGDAMQMYLHLMKSPGPLSPQQREMIATVVSSANDCFY